MLVDANLLQGKVTATNNAEPNENLGRITTGLKLCTPRNVRVGRVAGCLFGGELSCRSGHRYLGGDKGGRMRHPGITWNWFSVGSLSSPASRRREGHLDCCLEHQHLSRDFNSKGEEP